MSTDFYAVSVEEFAEVHYIKRFRKKYLNAWTVTESSLIGMCARIKTLIGTGNKVEIISTSGDIQILKGEFRVAQTKESAKSSGNRFIIAVNNHDCVVKILLVYSKSDVSGKHETVWWKNEVAENFPEYRSMLS